MENNAAATAMPRYICVKQVHALKIKSLLGFQITFEDALVAPLMLKPEMIARYTPAPGDYLVVYEDGFQSISPAVAFESGYRSAEDMLAKSGTAEIENGFITIRLAVAALQTLVDVAYEARVLDIPFDVTGDHTAFAASLMKALNARIAELDSSSIIERGIDAAIIQALEDGADGVVERPSTDL